MPKDDVAQDIQLQFLEEAQEYLNEIEAGLLGMSSQGLDRANLDRVLRAAHSIKGGAGMMGFAVLSKLAHRLEDSFKILKVRPAEVSNSDIEIFLLSGVDHLRDIARHYRQSSDIASDWLAEIVYPTFDGLQAILGDLQPDDEANLLSEDAGGDMVVLLFESEVDSILTRLDEVLANPEQPCLASEFAIAAQELAGLGEMLDLSAFRDLCMDVSAQLAAVTSADQVAPLTILAQQTWRKAQAMVMIGQRSLIPASLSLQQQAITPPSFPDAKITEWDLGSLDDSALDDLDESSAPELIYPLEAETLLDSLDDIAAHLTKPTYDFIDSVEPSTPVESLSLYPILGTRDKFSDLSLDLSAELQDSIQNSQLKTQDFSTPASIQTQIKATATDTITAEATDERTIRVSAHQLNQMGEFLGELTLERNGLALQLKRLRELTHLLTQRVQNLEQSNIQLRAGYDKVTTQIATPTFMGGVGVSTSGISISSHPPESSLTQSFDLLEMDRYSELHSLSQELMETAVQIEEVTTDITTNLDEAEQTTRALTRTTKQLQVGMTQMRMRPISDLLERFPRMIRDLSLQHGKAVELKISGGSTLLDRLVLETLNDPLIHLLRNAFDHGIEDSQTRLAQGKSAQGTIEISAAYRGNQTLITLRDDGGGINLEKIKAKAIRMGIDQATLESASSAELLDLIFEPGFSTAEQVTDLSGRGVGMDIIRTNLQTVRGSIRVDTQPDRGTTFTLSVPFTLSVLRVLLVESGNLLMAFPTDVVEEMQLLDPQNIVVSEGQTFLTLDDERIPLVALQDWLKFPRPISQADIESAPKISEPTVLLVAQGDQFVAIQVERYWGEQEVTIRQVEGHLPLPGGFVGCTVLGDGRIAPLVDPTSLLQQIEHQAEQQRMQETDSPALWDAIASPAQTETAPINPNQSPLVMIVDDSINVRRFLALTLEKAGFRVEQAKDGQHALEKVQMGLPIQAVVCDIEMPRLDGYGFLANIKAIPSAQSIPVVMLTSRSGDKHRNLAMTLGASDYFSKPFREQELLQTLAQLIADPR